MQPSYTNTQAYIRWLKRNHKNNAGYYIGTPLKFNLQIYTTVSASSYESIWEFLTTREVYCGPVCLYVCQTITFESLDIRSLFVHIWYISREYGTSS